MTKLPIRLAGELILARQRDWGDRAVYLIMIFMTYLRLNIFLCMTRRQVSYLQRLFTPPLTNITHKSDAQILLLYTLRLSTSAQW